MMSSSGVGSAPGSSASLGLGASSFPSPRSLDSTRSSWSQCLLPKKRNADEIEDLKCEGEYNMLSSIMSHADEHPEDIQIMLAHKNRLAERHAQKDISHADVGTTFKHFGSLGACDEEIIARWVVNHSDMSLVDLQLCKVFDRQAPYQLFSAATQIPISWQVSPVLRNTVLFNQFADWRDTICGHRIRNIKAKIGQQGKINWDGVCYTISWQENEVQAVTHAQSGKEAILPVGHGLNTNYDFNHFWHDLGAEACLPPMKPIKIATFFKEKRNAEYFGYPFVTSSKTENKNSTKIHELNEAYIANLNQSKGTGADDDVTKMVQQANQELAKKSIESAREKRLEQLEEKRESRKLAVPKGKAKAKEGGKGKGKSTE